MFLKIWSDNHEERKQGSVNREICAMIYRREDKMLKNFEIFSQFKIYVENNS